MTPFGTARTAIDKSVGFDTDTALTAVSAMEFAAAGFTFACRYLSRGEEAAADLEAIEVRAIHETGLAVVPIQHVHTAPWMASGDLGLVLGQEAAQNASDIGCPAGVALWLDLEGIASACPASSVVAFCNAWDQEVRSGGFDSGLYVGAACGLTSSQLYRDLTVSKYWRSLSRSAPVVDVRGFQVIQSFGGTLGGVSYDRNAVAKDNMGDLFEWWAP